ncbi:hypothetical protein [Clostridium coskatii]|jgi:predicted nucleic acid-binding protein|uniref:PIN domain-containing protein n=1 Tax=Clostridium coskatii TaxID=1705578 RepID=A0A166TDJ7_9CLOT|nr:hypothetical protein [Clostridium coskatii]OAA93549.1 hypothetical protein WX73_04314 [Clostridium coskatii]OBR96338.1 hypothetical protein CLCOS_10510 [Clostridium coskatii]
MEKYEAAISDTDILINLAKVDKIEILKFLFSKIVIPYFIYNVELRRKAGPNFSKIEKVINEENSIFEIVNREEDFVVNSLAKPIINDKKNLIGPGESECAGYASALNIPIIISDNHTEFKWLDEYITLTHNNILSLCVYFKFLTDIEGEEIFNAINRTLSRPSSLSFDAVYTKSFRRFYNNKWGGFLRLHNS